MNTAATVEEYIAGFPEEIRVILETIRTVIRKNAPTAVEGISYGMPAYRQHAVLVYFAAQKKHLGFYPTGSGVAGFADRLGAYKTSKGAIQFPYDKPIPLELIAEMVRFRVNEDAAIFAAKKAKKKNPLKGSAETK
ncbi:MAG: iron chaperone [Bacteroidota bacterium]